ncbi:MAG: 3-deoxy-7-phosphoheptulonate synthase [Bacilli bacterium]|nr:3-deoxy-7-phosphoheptulonate synthase [Bacilli bacterium]
MNMIFKRKLPIPQEIKQMYPLDEDLLEIKEQRDIELKRILSGEEDRLILVIGPCSADNEKAVLEYIGHLKEIEPLVNDEIFIIPRIYTNKPRTTGAGYKGMLHQPNPNQGEDMLKGVVAIRKLHIEALKRYGFTCADEMLYPENHRYLSDILCYVAVGARSVEDQQHRLTASGLNIPCGMKNPTSGDLSVMMNSIKAAQSPHMFIYRGWEVETKGNPYTHAILRGYVNKRGVSTPNYHYEDLIALNKLFKEANVMNPGVIVDCNHANSGKQFEEQIRIAKDILHSAESSEEVYKLVKGLMIESYLVDGAQKPGENEYGKSITDPCLGWEKTRELILDLAETRRKHKNK